MSQVHQFASELGCYIDLPFDPLMPYPQFSAYSSQQFTSCIQFCASKYCDEVPTSKSYPCSILCYYSSPFKKNFVVCIRKFFCCGNLRSLISWSHKDVLNFLMVQYQFHFPLNQTQDSTAQVVLDYDYMALKRSNRLIKGQIIGTLSEEITQVLGVDFGTGVWNALKSKFASFTMDELVLHQQIQVLKYESGSRMII